MPQGFLNGLQSLDQDVLTAERHMALNALDGAVALTSASYPVGHSVMVVTSASTGWPTAAGYSILTVKAAANQGYQMAMIANLDAVSYMRRWNNAGSVWGSWLPLQFGGTKTITADVTNNNATANTLADVTNLFFPVTAGKSNNFRFVIFYTAAATTTGSRWSINGPASPTALAYRSEYSLTATTKTFNDYVAAYNSPAAANASSIVAANVAIIEGSITPSADGIVVARFASEIASSAIVAKAGSSVTWQVA